MKNRLFAALAIAALASTSAHAVNAKYAQQLERSGCTQATEAQGCDITKTKAENARAGFGSVADDSGSDRGSYNSSGRAPKAAIRACNKFADQGYDGAIVSQNAMKPGWWEIILRFEQYRYVCNVSSRGQVESFNKID